MDTRMCAAVLCVNLALAAVPSHARPAVSSNAFAVHTLTVEVDRADGSPVPGALVRAVSDEWGWRRPRDPADWAVTDAAGRTSLTVIRGAWTVVAGGGLAFGDAHPNGALFLAAPGVPVTADTLVVLRADAVTTCAISDAFGAPLGAEMVRAVRACDAPGVASVPIGWSATGALALETSSATGSTRLLAMSGGNTDVPAYLLSGLASPGASLALPASAAALARVTLASYDVSGAPSDGLTDIAPVPWDASGFSWTVESAPVRAFYTDLSRVRLRHRLPGAGDTLAFTPWVRDLGAGADVAVGFGGPLAVSLRVVAQAAPAAGARTPVWLRVTDAHGHELAATPTGAAIAVAVDVRGSRAIDTTVTNLAFSLARDFEPEDEAVLAASVPCGSFGTLLAGDSLLAARNRFATSAVAYGHFTSLAPAEWDDATISVLGFLEAELAMLEPLAWGPLGVPLQWVPGIDGCGMAGATSPLDVPLAMAAVCDAGDPATLGCASVALASVRLSDPACERRLQVPLPEYAASYACALGAAGLDALLPAPSVAAIRGAHDLALRHLADGTAVADEAARAEALAWVEEWIRVNVGWEAHRKVMFGYQTEYAGLVHELGSRGFADAEIVPVLYSTLAGGNLGALWDAAGLGVTAARVQAGLDAVATFAGVAPAAATRPRLTGPAPNPCAREAVFRLALPAACAARVEVFDVAGRRITTLASGAQPAGERTLRWDLRDASGAACAPGLYFCRLATAGATGDLRVVVTR